jgi:2-methylcitrate dehydratase PrpD
MSISALADCVGTIRAESEHHRASIGLHTADTLAVLAAGLKAHEGERIARFFGAGDGSARAAGMAAVIRFTECDDIHVPSCMTAGAIVVPVALTFAVDSQSYARAVEAGYTVGLAFAQAVGGVAALSHGVWPALFAAPAVAAVTTSVAMNCDRTVIAGALGLAIAGTSGRAGRPGGWPSGRWFAFGEAALRGIRAALAALQGFRGDTDLISDAWLRRQTAPELAAIECLSGLVEGAVAQVCIKPYVAARQGANAIQAFVTLLEQGQSPKTIERVKVFLPPEATGIVTRPLDPANRLSTIAHLGLQLGIAAHERERLLDIDRARSFKPDTLALADRVTVVADDNLLSRGGPSWPARVRIHTRDGAAETLCEVLSGDPHDRHQAQHVQRKRECLGVVDAPLDPAGWCGDGWHTFFQAQRRVFAALDVPVKEDAGRLSNIA